MKIDVSKPLTIEEIENYMYNGSVTEQQKMLDYIWTYKIKGERIINAVKYLANNEMGICLNCDYKIWHLASALLFLLTNEHSELYKTKGELNQFMIDRLIPDADGVFRF